MITVFIIEEVFFILQKAPRQDFELRSRSFNHGSLHFLCKKKRSLARLRAAITNFLSEEVFFFLKSTSTRLWALITEFRIEQFSCEILSHIFWKVLEIANCCLPLGGLDDFIAELNPSYGACGSKSEESSRNKSQYLCIYNYIYRTSQAHSRCKCHWNIWARILCGNNWEGSRTLNLEDTDWSHGVYLGLSLWMNIMLSRHFGKQALWAILCARLAISVARIYIMAVECF